MSRNSQGLYTLPAGNPVVPGTLIEAQWANDTLGDVASALTGSLPRDGTAPMTGPLTLASAPPTQGRHAASKAYVDAFVAYSTGMPIGSIMAYGSVTTPVGFLLCDGTIYQNSAYPELASLLGTTYGGTPGTSFGVPDLRDEFVRGRGDGRTLGSKQAGSLASHLHPVSDPGHNHTITNPAHTHGITQSAHAHGVTDPGHAHTVDISQAGTGGDGSGGADRVNYNANPTTVSGTGISIQGANANISVNSATQATTAAPAVTGLSVGAAGGTETRPQNTALDYYIKAINDSTTQIGVTSLASSDDNVIAIDDTDPAIPVLDIKSNVAFGLVKLDAGNKIPLGLLPDGTNSFLGYWDASSGNLPTGTFTSGSYYLISVEGTLTVYDPATGTPSAQVITVGSTIRYVDSVPNPVGWYYTAASGAVLASDVSIVPIAGLTATDAQAAFAELVAKDASNLVAANNFAVAMAIALG